MSASKVKVRSENKSEPNMYDFWRYSLKTNNVLQVDSVSHLCNNLISLYTLVNNHADLDHLENKCYWVRMTTWRQDKNPIKLSKHNACPQKAVRQTKIFYSIYSGDMYLCLGSSVGKTANSRHLYIVHEVISSSVNNRARNGSSLLSSNIYICAVTAAYVSVSCVKLRWVQPAILLQL